jgi:hypothetical protein
MATNTAAPFGLKPWRHKSGAPYNGSARLYYVPASDSQALYIGDPVTTFQTYGGSGTAGTGLGSNSAAYYGNFPGTLPICSLATAGDSKPIIGAVVGFFAEQASSTVYRAASTARGVWVVDDPEIEFHIMDDGVATLNVGAGAGSGGYAIGDNGNLNLSTYSGSTATGMSGATLSTTLSTSGASTGQLKILGLVPGVKNNANTPNAVWRVMINNHLLTAGTTGY